MAWDTHGKNPVRRVTARNGYMTSSFLEEKKNEKRRLNRPNTRRITPSPSLYSYYYHRGARAVVGDDGMSNHGVVFPRHPLLGDNLSFLRKIQPGAKAHIPATPHAATYRHAYSMRSHNTTAANCGYLSVQPATRPHEPICNRTSCSFWFVLVERLTPCPKPRPRYCP